MLKKGIQLIRDCISIRCSRKAGERGHTFQLIECSEPGGAERMLLQLAMNLAPPYHATLGLLTSGWLETEVLRVGLPYVMLGRHGHKDLDVICDLVRVIKERSISIIHAHEFYMGVIGAVISCLTGTPLVVTIHGKNYYPEKMRRRALFRFMAARASGLVMVSEDLRRFVSKATGVGVFDVLVIQNGVELGDRAALHSPFGLRARAGIPDEAKIVGTVGALFPVKGQQFLVQGLKILRDQGLNVHLIILGEGDQREQLRAEAVGLGMQAYVHLLGFCDRVADALPEMDVFALPSLSEGLPLALLEAMAASRPVVATTVGGVPEVVIDGKTGMLVPPGDAGALADKLATVLGDQRLAAQLGSAARDAVRKDFSLALMLQRYQDLYRQCLTV
ncbi:MAG: glycosyltransferase [Nitrospira sp.]